jgi:hypothetical protein
MVHEIGFSWSISEDLHNVAKAADVCSSTHCKVAFLIFTSLSPGRLDWPPLSRATIVKVFSKVSFHSHTWIGNFVLDSSNRAICPKTGTIFEPAYANIRRLC